MVSRIRFGLYVLVAFVFGWLYLMGCAGAPNRPTWSNATGAEQYERLMWKAIQGQDWKELDRHIAPIFVGTNGSGQAFDHPGWIQYWKTHPVRMVSFTDVSVQPAGEDMLVTYVLDLADDPEQSRSSSYRALSVWKDIKGRWTLTAFSCTPIRP